MASLVVYNDGEKPSKRFRSARKYVEGMKYEERTCVMLREELGKRGLKKSGKKKELIERLKDNDEENLRAIVSTFYTKFKWKQIVKGDASASGRILRTIYCQFGKWCVEKRYMVHGTWYRILTI